MYEQLIGAVATFAAKRALIVGDLMLDEYVLGTVRRISPEAPVPVLEVRQRRYLPGGAANTAVNVISLGGCSLLAGLVGADPQADLLRGALLEAGVDCSGVLVDQARPTTTKTRIAASSQQIVRVDAEQREQLSAQLEQAIVAWAAEHIARCDVFILSDYAKGVVSPGLASALIGLARTAGLPVVIDPKGADFMRYRGATVITPNVAEVAQALERRVEDDASVRRAGRDLAEQLAGTIVLITRGADGMTAFHQGREIAHVPAVARYVYDVTGAGDTVVSTLALALAAGIAPEPAIWLANQAAGVVVGKFGTALATADELIESLQHANDRA